MRTEYVIEARDESGALDFASPQPEDFFGRKAIRGIDEDEIAQSVWRAKPDVVLEGMFLLRWASYIDPRFKTRVKYWRS